MPQSCHMIRTACICTIIFFCIGAICDLRSATSGSPDQSNSTSPISQYSPEDNARISEIMVRVVNDPDYLNDETHKEFWGILLQHGHVSSREMTELRHEITQNVLLSQQYFWEDALIAWRVGRPAKSVKREQHEKRLVATGFIPEWRVRENEKLIEQIAARQAVQFGEGKVLVSEEYIRAALSRLDGAIRRLDQLLTPPVGFNKRKSVEGSFDH